MGERMPPHDYPDVLRALSDFALEHGRDGEAATMREIADWIEEDYPRPKRGIRFADSLVTIMPRPRTVAIRLLSPTGAELHRAPAHSRMDGNGVIALHIVVPDAMTVAEYEVIGDVCGLIYRGIPRTPISLAAGETFRVDIRFD